MVLFAYKIKKKTSTFRQLMLIYRDLWNGPSRPYHGPNNTNIQLWHSVANLTVNLLSLKKYYPSESEMIRTKAETENNNKITPLIKDSTDFTTFKKSHSQNSAVFTYTENLYKTLLTPVLS
jgi:hypothetical protein